MFEKKAEEWVKENMDCCKTDNSVNQSIPYFDEEERCVAKSAFQDGAEFGYNKALEEIGDLRDCCNCKHWHYSTRSQSYYCDKTDRNDDCERQYYRCEHWEH